jgi:ABC-type glycerol-3-phosphate transport system permease component
MKNAKRLLCCLLALALSAGLALPAVAADGDLITKRLSNTSVVTGRKLELSIEVTTPPGETVTVTWEEADGADWKPIDAVVAANGLSITLPEKQRKDFKYLHSTLTQKYRVVATSSNGLYEENAFQVTYCLSVGDAILSALLGYPDGIRALFSSQVLFALAVMILFPVQMVVFPFFVISALVNAARGNLHLAF